MWVWTWAAAALLWLQTAGVRARQESKKPRQLAVRVDSPNITTSSNEGLPGSFKVDTGWEACGCVCGCAALLGQLFSPISRLHCLRP